MRVSRWASFANDASHFRDMYTSVHCAISWLIAACLAVVVVLIVVVVPNALLLLLYVRSVDVDWVFFCGCC